MFQVAALVLPLFGLIFLGFLAGKIKRISYQGLEWMNFFIVYIALPPLFFNLLSKTPVSEFGNSRFLISTTIGSFAVFVFCFLIAKFIIKTNTQVATIQSLAGAYGNIGYMGPPLAIAAFGTPAGVPVALVFCLDNAMHFILTPTLMAIGGRNPEGIGSVVRGIGIKIFTHPFILATIVGITAAYFQFSPPEFVATILDMLANAAAPCALFVMGVTAALRPIRRIPMELSYLVPIKLIIHPALIYVLLIQIPDLDRVWLHAAVLLAALPSATNVFVLAQQYGIWEDRASSAVVVSTSLSIISVTAYIYLATTGIL